MNTPTYLCNLCLTLDEILSVIGTQMSLDVNIYGQGLIKTTWRINIRLTISTWVWIVLPVTIFYIISVNHI